MIIASTFLRDAGERNATSTIHPLTPQRDWPKDSASISGIRLDTMNAMDAGRTLRHARLRAGLTLRELAGQAGTSHSTLAAYESTSKSPTVATFDRVLQASGFHPDVELHRRHRGTTELPRGEELAAVLKLAAAFPARHTPHLEAPVFGRSS